MLQVLFSGFYALGGELSSEMRGAFRATQTARSPQISWKEQTHPKISHHAALRNMINFGIFQLSFQKNDVFIFPNKRKMIPHRVWEPHEEEVLPSVWRNAAIQLGLLLCVVSVLCLRVDVGKCCGCACVFSMEGVPPVLVSLHHSDRGADCERRRKGRRWRRRRRRRKTRKSIAATQVWWSAVTVEEVQRPWSFLTRFACVREEIRGVGGWSGGSPLSKS